MGVTLANDPTQFIIAMVYKNGIPIAQEDQRVIGRLSPLLSTITKTFLLYEKSKLVLSYVDDLLTDGDPVAVCLASTLRLVHAPARLRDRLVPYFGELFAEPLPSPVMRWLERAVAPTGVVQPQTGPWTWRHVCEQGVARFEAFAIQTGYGGVGLLLRIHLEERAENRSALEKVGLTPREIETLSYLPHGLTNHQIALAMGVREVTIKKHLRNASHKLGACGKTELLFRVMQLAGAVSPRYPTNHNS